MNKNNIKKLILFLIFGSLFFSTGFFYGYKKFKNSNDELSKEIDFIKFEKEYYSSEQYKNGTPVDINEYICMDNAKNSDEIINCIEKSEKDWSDKLENTLFSLKKSLKKEQYEQITESQKLWKEQSKKDKEIINNVVYIQNNNKYKIYAAEDCRNIIKSRAEFLDWILYIKNN